MNEVTLDARHLLCPLPVIRVQDRIRDLHAGDILTVTCTDPGANYDIPAWCRVHGHQVLESRTENEEIVIRIQIADVR